MIKKQLEEIGFVKAALGLSISLGRGRALAVSDPGGTNEMMFLEQFAKGESAKIEDLICVHNSDYDGPLAIEKVTGLIKLIKHKHKPRRKPTEGLRVKTFDEDLFGQDGDGRSVGGYVYGTIKTVHDDGGMIIDWDAKGIFGAMTTDHASSEWGRQVKLSDK